MVRPRSDRPGLCNQSHGRKISDIPGLVPWCCLGNPDFIDVIHFYGNFFPIFSSIFFHLKAPQRGHSRMSQPQGVASSWRDTGPSSKERWRSADSAWWGWLGRDGNLLGGGGLVDWLESPNNMPRCSMVLEYLPTKLGEFWGKCW